MNKLTRSEAEAMPQHERVNAYFQHNTASGNGKVRYRSDGPSCIAQMKFWYNWRAALFEWVQSLPVR
jgi:hypothetical protein